MGRERRGAPRYVVDGLRVSLDGVEHAILDLAVSSVRVLRQPVWPSPPPNVVIGVWSEAEFVPVDFRCSGFLMRRAANELVYGFDVVDADWPSKLPLFDTFKDCRVPELED